MNLSRSLVEVGVSMVLKDKFSQEAGRVSNSFRTMMNDMNTWNRGVQTSASNVFDAGVNMVSGMAKAYKYSAGVQNEVWMASKISGATVNQQKEMLQLAKDINERTPLTASDVASGQKFLAMAGNKLEAIKGMSGPVAELASIFSMPMGGKGGIADLMTNIMSMYQIPMGNAAAITDDLYTATTNANISLTDLAQSIAYAGADMSTAGVSLRQTAAAIGVLGDMGIQGSMAGTSLANMIRYLQLSLVGQKKKGYNALAGMGLSPDEFFDAKGNLIDLYTIYQKFAKASLDMPSRLETPTFFNIFGVRGNRGMLPVLRDIASGRDKMKTILGEYDKNSGVVHRTNLERLTTPAGIIDQWESGLENLTVTAGQALAKSFNPLLKGLNFIVKLVDKISSTWGGSFLIRVVATGTVIATLVAGYRVISSTLKFINTYQASSVKLSTSMAKSSSSITASMAATNLAAISLETHLRNISILLSVIASKNMAVGSKLSMMGGYVMGVNKKGRRYYKGPDGKIVSSQQAFGPVVATSTAAKPASTIVRQTASKRVAATAARTAASATTKTLAKTAVGIGVLGKLGSRLLSFLPGWGLALAFGLPLLIDGITALTSSVNNNTNKKADLKDPQAIRAENERKFIEAVRLAIKEGMKGSKINITVDGETMSGYTPGTEQDYTGVTLGIL